MTKVKIIFSFPIKWVNIGVMDHDESEGRRGRNSALDEVEDDDIVNQNSSKSSSKERFIEGS